MLFDPRELVPSMFIGEVDVLSILSQDPEWIAYRGHRIGAWLEKKGLSHKFTRLYPAAELSKIIESVKPKVVLNECLISLPEDISRLAERFQETQFVNVLHGAPSYCFSLHPDRAYHFIRLSVDRKNIHVATVSDPTEQAWLPGSKVVHLPNLIEVPKDLANKDPRPYAKDEPLCVSIVARPALIKNWGGMVSTIGILSRRRPVKAFLVGKKEDSSFEAHLDYLNDLGVDSEVHFISDWADNLRRIQKNVHVGLACGYSDSLNLVAAEHSLLGIPVVGSNVLSWLPANQRVCPQDPKTASDIIERLADTEGSGMVGRSVARSMSARSEIILEKTLRVLLSV